MKNFIYLALSCFVISSSFAAAPKKPYEIRWVLAHEPIGLFKEAADVFSKEVSANSHGQIKVEVLTLPEYVVKYNKGKEVKNKDFLALLRDGHIQMSQTYTTDLGKLSQSLYVLDLPFLFRSHDHAKKVLEGEIGDKLLASLTPSNIRGLAFTYSGGYRVIPGTKRIDKLEDFKGMKIRTSASPIAQETFNALGATAVPMSLDGIDAGIKSGKIDEAESTYARYFTLNQNKVAKIVNETNHSLFLTSIIVNDKFWNKLPKEYKEIMKTAAINAARVERAHSIAGTEETKQRCVKEGVEVVTLNKTEEDKFKLAMEPVYKKFSPLVGADLITSIQQQ
ncbi:MAG: TRAP transporter substrate-binding protein [Rhizobacter sp.]|nr:TRAP transporter substrate-binding protein [Bacteriovorax sp.]